MDDVMLVGVMYKLFSHYELVPAKHWACPSMCEYTPLAVQLDQLFEVTVTLTG